MGEPGPPPPVALPRPEPFPPVHLRSVRAGCWLVNYTPTGSSVVSFDGTLRVEAHSAGRTASGDLYQRPVILLPFPPGPPHPILLPGPNPANGVPILSRSRYRFYLRVTQILENFTFGNSFQLGFEMWRFTAPSSWALEDIHTLDNSGHTRMGLGAQFALRDGQGALLPHGGARAGPCDGAVPHYGR